ncbi:MAG: hypothetical protein ABIQ38_07510 [Ilumatobacteraceae bacterium]
MIAYKLKLADYVRAQKLIAENFFSTTAVAEATCDKATHSQISYLEQDAAQAAFKSEICAASRVRSEALKALGPPPIMPFGHQSTEHSHDSHKIEP